MIALAIVMASLMVPVGILAQKIKNLKEDESEQEMTSPQKGLDVRPAESVEEMIKKQEE